MPGDEGGLVRAEPADGGGDLFRRAQLPKVRDVVSSLAINPNTVLKAYRELETKGLAAGRPGQGTFIEGTSGRGRHRGAVHQRAARFP